MFHHFHNEDHPSSQGSIDEVAFKKIIQHLDEKFNLISADTWLDKAMKDELKSEDVCLTFDDSLMCQYDIAKPVLDEFKINAFWFLCSSLLEGNLELLEVFRYFRTNCFDGVEDFYSVFFKAFEDSSEQDFKKLSGFDPDKYLAGFPFYTLNDRKFRYIRDKILGVEKYNSLMCEMFSLRDFDPASIKDKLWMGLDHAKELEKDGHILGLHTHSHPTMVAGLSYENQLSEYEVNKVYLEKHLTQKSLTMSHPCNSYNKSTIEILNNLGVKIGFRANMAKIQSSGKFEFPREDHANLVKELNL